MTNLSFIPGFVLAPILTIVALGLVLHIVHSLQKKRFYAMMDKEIDEAPVDSPEAIKAAREEMEKEAIFTGLAAQLEQDMYDTKPKAKMLTADKAVVTTKTLDGKEYAIIFPKGMTIDSALLKKKRKKPKKRKKKK